MKKNIINQPSRVVIIDVREPVEYQALHLPGAINIPATSSLQHFDPYVDQPVRLVCNTGFRARKVMHQLRLSGFEDVEVHHVRMQSYSEQFSVGIEGSWTVDRQFRLALGLLLSMSILGTYFLSDQYAFIAVIIALGLTITAIIDRCYFKMLIARMPWNRIQTVERPLGLQTE